MMDDITDLDAYRADPGLDPEVSAWLRVLDPATEEPNYWFRFRSWVVESAGPELARRRLLADVSVGDVLQAWSRTLLPTALAAAAAAAFLLFQSPATVPENPLLVEDLLVAELGDDPIPAALSLGNAVTFAADRF